MDGKGLRGGVVALVACLLAVGAAGCAQSNPALGGQTTAQVNISREARLDLTTAIVVSEEAHSRNLRPGEATPGVPPRTRTPGEVWSWDYLTTIADPQAIAELVKALDREESVPVGLGLACIPNYRLEFQRSDGVTVSATYLCDPEDDDDFFTAASASDGSYSLPGPLPVHRRFGEVFQAQVEAARSAAKATPTRP